MEACSATKRILAQPVESADRMVSSRSELMEPLT